LRNWFTDISFFELRTMLRRLIGRGMGKLLMFAACCFLFVNSSLAQINLDYRTTGDVTFDNPTNWEKYISFWGWNPAPDPPIWTDRAITIRDGHTATLTSDKRINEVIIEAGAELIINPGVTADDFSSVYGFKVYGTLTNNGTIENLSSSEVFGTGRIDNYGTIEFGPSEFLDGDGQFYLYVGATIITANPLGLNGSIQTATWSLSPFANYTFNGVQAQVPGTKLPDEVNDFTIDNVNGITLTDQLEVNGILHMKSGNITNPTHKLILNNADHSSLDYTAGMINGQFERYIDDASEDYFFPVGKTGPMRSLNVNFTNLTPGSMLVEFEDGDPGDSGLPLTDDDGSLITDHFTTGYWTAIARNSLASTNYDLALNATTFSPGNINASTRIIKRSDFAGDWELDGNHSLALGTMVKRTDMNSIKPGGGGSQFGIAQALPNITTQPADQTACENEDVTFSVTATGSSLWYNWYKSPTNALTNDGHFSGVSTSDLEITNLASGDAGGYYCIVSDGSGNESTSDTAALTVNPNPMAEITGCEVVCSGSEITMNGNPNSGSVPYTNHEWDVVTSNIISLTNNNDGTATIEPDNTGRTTINYTVTDSKGCSGSAFFNLGVNQAPEAANVSTGQPTEVIADAIAARWKGFSNNAASDALYLGYSSLAGAPERQEYTNISYLVPGENAFSFAYDKGADKLTASININTIEYPDVINNVNTFSSGDADVNGMNYLNVYIRNSKSGNISLNNLFLNDSSLTSLHGSGSDFNKHWTITGIDFGAGFTLTGTITLDSILTQYGNNENSKVQFTVGERIDFTCLSADPILCSGNKATVTLSGLISGRTYTANYSIDNGAEETSASFTADASGNGSFETIALTNATTNQVSKTIAMTKLNCGTASLDVDCNNLVTVTVHPEMDGGTIAGANSICYNTDAPALSSTTEASGGDESISYSWYKTTNLSATPGDLDYTLIAGAAASGYDPGPLVDTTKYVRKAMDVTCGVPEYSNEIQINVLPDMDGGAIAGANSICYNTDAPALSSTTEASGGDESISYSWYETTNLSATPGDLDYTLIAGATASGYDPGLLVDTAKYVRKAMDVTCGVPEYSNEIQINVLPDMDGGAIAGANSICYNTDAPALSSTTEASGGDESISYSWYKTTNLSATPGDLDYTLIAGAAASGYDPGPLVDTTKYVRKAMDVTCGVPEYSNEIQINVFAEMDGGTIDGDTSLCYNTDAPALSSTTDATGGSGFITYTWYETYNLTAAIGDGSWLEVGANSHVYDPGVLTDTTRYVRKAVDASCGVESYSNEFTIDLLPPMEAGEIGSDASICYNTNAPEISSTIDATGGDGNIIYTWYKTNNLLALTHSTDYLPIPSVTSADYTPGLLIDTTKYIRKAVDGTCLVEVISNEITIIVLDEAPVDVSIKAATNKVCNGSSVRFTANPSFGGLSPFYQWYVNGSMVASDTGMNVYTYKPFDGDTINCVLTSSIGYCATGNPATSNAEIIVVEALPFVQLISSTSMCEGESISLEGSPAGGTFNLVDGPGSIFEDVLTATGAGTINVEYIYSDFCSNKDTKSIIVNEKPLADAGSDQDLRFKYETQMKASLSLSETGVWSVLSGTGKISDIHSPTTLVSELSSGENIFRWAVQNEHCTASEDVIISVSDQFIPSVITPNGDGKNDFLLIGKSVGKVELIIFNRWGNEVYTNNNYLNDWDGRNNKGAELPNDTYFYVLKFEYGSIRKGAILIKR
jgi:gliding motility-associated-like protein